MFFSIKLIIFNSYKLKNHLENHLRAKFAGLNSWMSFVILFCS